METIKYDIYKCERTLNRKEIKNLQAGVTVNTSGDVYSSCIESFDDYEQAKKRLNSYSTNVTVQSGYCYVIEYFIEKNKHDENGDPCDCGDIMDFTPMDIALCDKRTDETVATFDNMTDALKRKNEYENEEDENGFANETYIVANGSIINI